jgi:hypothetical protein
LFSFNFQCQCLLSQKKHNCNLLIPNKFRPSGDSNPQQLSLSADAPSIVILPWFTGENSPFNRCLLPIILRFLWRLLGALPLIFTFLWHLLGAPEELATAEADGAAVVAQVALAGLGGLLEPIL